MDQARKKIHVLFKCRYSIDRMSLVSITKYSCHRMVRLFVITHLRSLGQEGEIVVLRS